MSDQESSTKSHLEENEVEGVYYELDTAQPGPFLLPPMDEFEETIVQIQRGQILLQFRSRDQKRFLVPLPPENAERMISLLKLVLKSYSIEDLIINEEIGHEKKGQKH